MYGLPVNDRGKVEKTEANAIHMRDSIVKSAEKDTTEWYTNGQYQGETRLGCASINIYDKDSGYYLKFYSAELYTKTLDVLKNRSIARDKFLDHLIEKGESIDDIENYDLIDCTINNL